MPHNRARLNTYAVLVYSACSEFSFLLGHQQYRSNRQSQSLLPAGNYVLIRIPNLAMQVVDTIKLVLTSANCGGGTNRMLIMKVPASWVLVDGLGMSLRWRAGGKYGEIWRLWIKEMVKCKQRTSKDILGICGVSAWQGRCGTLHRLTKSD